jgi:hypothetical protein
MTANFLTFAQKLSHMRNKEDTISTVPLLLLGFYSEYWTVSLLGFCKIAIILVRKGLSQVVISNRMKNSSIITRGGNIISCGVDTINRIVQTLNPTAVASIFILEAELMR